MAFLKGNHLAFLNLFIPGLLSQPERCGSHRESQNHQYFTALIKLSRELLASQLVPFPKQVLGMGTVSRGAEGERGVWLTWGGGAQDFIDENLSEL